MDVGGGFIGEDDRVHATNNNLVAGKSKNGKSSFIFGSRNSAGEGRKGGEGGSVLHDGSDYHVSRTMIYKVNVKEIKESKSEVLPEALRSNHRNDIVVWLFVCWTDQVSDHRKEMGCVKLNITSR